MKLKFMAEAKESLDIIKQIMICMLEITEFKNLVVDGYGIGKGGYWSFRKDFRNKELEIMELEYEYYSRRNKRAKISNRESFDEIALKFKKSLDRTNRSGWL